jgi:hypothetical protein
MTATRNVRVLCENPTTPCEVFFCTDCTGSMGSETGGHRATESAAKFLDDMMTAGVVLKLGGVKFNEPGAISSAEEIVDSELSSLDAFATVDSFISDWVHDDYAPNGGDEPELQLDALHLAAQDMGDYSTPGNPNRYIVLITDHEFHYLNDPYPSSGCSVLTKADEVDELTTSGCRVYISLWGGAYEGDYQGLTVNGGEFDPSGDDYSDMDKKYPLARLRARIMADWPTD